MKLNYIDYVRQYMSEMILDYIDLVYLLYVLNDIKLKNRVKYQNQRCNE